MKNIDASLQELKTAINYTLAVYKYCIAQLPDEVAFTNGMVQIGQFEFQRFSQVEGYIVELGWAFFVRMEATLEAHINRLEIKGKDIADIVSKATCLTQSEKEGYAVARELRNILHHGDGDPQLLKSAPLKVEIIASHEPHILPFHIENFSVLFAKVGKLMSTHAQNAA